MSKRPILLVEDTHTDEMLTLRALASSHVTNEIVVVRDGVEALDYLFGLGKFSGRDPRSHPQVMLLDLKLPKIDGQQVLLRVRADLRTKAIPVVILSSSSEDCDIVEGYELGANSYVRKPVDFAGFTEVVKQLSIYWTVINQSPQ